MSLREKNQPFEKASFFLSNSNSENLKNAAKLCEKKLTPPRPVCICKPCSIQLKSILKNLNRLPLFSLIKSLTIAPRIFNKRLISAKPLVTASRLNSVIP